MAKKSKKLVDETPASEAVSNPVAPAKQGLSVEVHLNKVLEFGGERIVVKVSLLQDGVEISSDADYVKL